MYLAAMTALNIFLIVMGVLQHLEIRNLERKNHSTRKALARSMRVVKTIYHSKANINTQLEGDINGSK